MTEFCIIPDTSVHSRPEQDYRRNKEIGHCGYKYGSHFQSLTPLLSQHDFSSNLTPLLATLLTKLEPSRTLAYKLSNLCH